MSDMEDLSKVPNDENIHKDLKPEVTSITDTDSETNEDDEYHDSLADIEAFKNINNDHETEEDDEYHDTLVNMEGLTDTLVSIKDSIEPTAKTTKTEATDNENGSDVYHDSLTSIISLTDITATDSGIDEDEEYHDSLTIGSVPEVTDYIITAHQYERNDNQESPADAPGSEEMHIDVRGSLSPTQSIATPATSSDSPEEMEYWDPVSDTYRSKKTNKSVPDESMQGMSEPTGYETDSSIESETVSSVDLDPWEYLDPVTDSYKSKKANDNYLIRAKDIF